jgi:hypothetical protein
MPPHGAIYLIGRGLAGAIEDITSAVAVGGRGLQITGTGKHFLAGGV